jgi:hypothetical protein
MSSAAVQQRYLSLADVARRWAFKQPKTVARIIRRHRPTAIAELSPGVLRVALKDVLAIEQKARSCGVIDLEGL